MRNMYSDKLALQNGMQNPFEYCIEHEAEPGFEMTIAPPL